MAGPCGLIRWRRVVVEDPDLHPRALSFFGSHEPSSAATRSAAAPSPKGIGGGPGGRGAATRCDQIPRVASEDIQPFCRVGATRFAIAASYRGLRAGVPPFCRPPEMAMRPREAAIAAIMSSDTAMAYRCAGSQRSAGYPVAQPGPGAWDGRAVAPAGGTARGHEMSRQPAGSSVVS